VAAAAVGDGRAADLSVREVVALLAAATPTTPADFSGKNLAGLDLSDLDLRYGDLSRVDLTGADLSGADLSGADLSGARLDRATIIRTNFAGANLSRATLLAPQAFPGMAPTIADAPSFRGANLSGARILANLTGVDMRGADASDLRMSADRSQRELRPPRSELPNGKLSGVRFARADLREAVFAFADLAGADLSDSDLRRANLSRADLTGAILTGANLAGADLDGAILRDVRGLDRAVGVDQARNVERAVR
jgi:uncharacterized protein YjbI with pentapeptide repeats